MAYCKNCGSKLIDSAKFCQKCGYPINSVDINTEKRQQYFSGKIYKCPHCGEILNSFESTCPSCGYELREVQTSNAIQEFSSRLNAIEAKRHDLKFNGLFAATRASQINAQKVSLIRNFPVPNTKEDMLEFMIMAVSNLNMKAFDGYTSISNDEKELNDAWFAKITQIYEKAKRTHFSDNTFSEITSLYNSCNRNIKKTKKNGKLKSTLLFACFPLFFIVAFIFIAILSNITESNEQKRLNNIIRDVQDALEGEEYKLALSIADSIDYQKNDTDQERKWDIQREYWTDKVISEAASHGIQLEYTPAQDIDNATNLPSANSGDNTFDDIKGSVDDFNSKMDAAKEQLDFIFDDSTEETMTCETDTTETSEVYHSSESDSYAIPLSATSSETNCRVINIEDFDFNIPEYWLEDSNKKEEQVYYAENDDSIVKLTIRYPVETDKDYDVSFNGLYIDDKNMVNAIEFVYSHGKVTEHEVFESNFGVKGILYHFTYKQRIHLFKKIPANGYYFCFPSEDDRRWFYVILQYTDNVNADNYIKGFMNILTSIKKHT